MKIFFLVADERTMAEFGGPLMFGKRPAYCGQHYALHAGECRRSCGGRGILPQMWSGHPHRQQRAEQQR